MGLINAAPIIGSVRLYRGAWITGGYGKGKTSFAYRLAYEYLKQGYRLVTNNRSIWADELEEVQLLPDAGMQLKAVVLLDEGGMYFKTGKKWEEMAQYVRKMDCIYLIPSHSSPATVAQEVTIEPLFSFMPCGIPLIVYKWVIRTRNVRETGFFAWWGPSEIYGIYSTLDPGDDCEDIVDFLFERTAEFKEYHGRGKQFRSLAGDEREDGSVASLLEAAEQFTQVANSLEAVSSRKRRRWRRFV